MRDNQNPSERPIAIDKVRASKAGQAYHEAWAARTALELLPPKTDLTAITLEGFDERDEQDLGTRAVEIADLVRYYGATDVARARRVSVEHLTIGFGGFRVPKTGYADTSLRRRRW
jgi:hypothetical protein